MTILDPFLACSSMVLFGRCTPLELFKPSCDSLELFRTEILILRTIDCVSFRNRAQVLKFFPLDCIFQSFIFLSLTHFEIRIRSNSTYKTLKYHMIESLDLFRHLLYLHTNLKGLRYHSSVSLVFT